MNIDLYRATKLSHKNNNLFHFDDKNIHNIHLCIKRIIIPHSHRSLFLLHQAPLAAPKHSLWHLVVVDQGSQSAEHLKYQEPLAVE